VTQDRWEASQAPLNDCGPGRGHPHGRELRVAARRTLAAVAITVGLGAACGDGPPARPELLETARDLVDRPAGTFEDETRLVMLLDSLIAEAGRDAEASAELSLLRLRAIERVIADSAARAHNPYSNLTDRPVAPEAVRAWLDAHSTEVAYSEPAGEWLVPADVFWRLHDRYRRTAYSDEIAWAAANAGLAGECEGFAGCYVDALLRTHGHYLETHPDGAYTGEALRHVTTLFEEIGEAEPGRAICGDGRETEGVTTDQLQRIRRTLERLPATAGDGRAAAERALAALEQRCDREA